LAEQVNPWLCCMAGTNQPVLRYRALEGVVGLAPIDISFTLGPPIDTRN